MSWKKKKIISYRHEVTRTRKKKNDTHNYRPDLIMMGTDMDMGTA